MGPILNGFFMAFIWGDPKQLLTGMILQVRITYNLAFGASELKRLLRRSFFVSFFGMLPTVPQGGPRIRL